MYSTVRCCYRTYTSYMSPQLKEKKSVEFEYLFSLYSGGAALLQTPGLVYLSE